MCRCTPAKRTPFCGAPGCEAPQGVGGAAGGLAFEVHGRASWRDPTESRVTSYGDVERKHYPYVEPTILMIRHKGHAIEIIEPLTLWVDAEEGERLLELFPEAATAADGESVAFTLGDFQVQWFIHGARLREVVDMLKACRP